MTTISESLRIAIKHHQAGRLDLAEETCRRILAVEPEHAAACYLIGIVAYQKGQLDVAGDFIARAIGLKGSVAAFHNDLGTVRQRQGSLAEAVACYRRALELDPGFGQAHYNLANALKQMGNLDEAIACYRGALESNPHDAEAHNNLGSAFHEQKRLNEAIACYNRALQLNPGLAAAHYNLGVAFKDLGKVADAVACYRRALVLNPDDAEALNNLGNSLRIQGDLDPAVACYRRALELNPDYAEAHNNLGNVLKDRGELDAAVASYRRAFEVKPDYRGAQSNYLYALHFCPGWSASAIYEEHQRWTAQCPPPPQSGHSNDRSPNRRLRIGYVSPDFCGHPVAQFLLPLLETHDHRQFEVFAYSSVLVPDAVTERCRTAVNVWRAASRLSDEELAAAVRADQIDVLVDLSMHMAGNRMLVFARKPAPVQVTYLAHCGTTGLETIDCRLTDPHLDPPGANDRFYSEESVRLPETYWCYRPLADSPPVGSLSDAGTSSVMFGCLNNFCKVSEPTLQAWCRLLCAVPRSRLLLHARRGTHRDRVVSRLNNQGVRCDRLTFVDFLPTHEYLQLYQQIHVALDPFPYGGGTTTCDALWMGVPVVSLAGQTAVGRSGLSILSNVGLPELVASDADQYVRIAAELAGDRPRLALLRDTLREQIRKSPLMDAPRFTRAVETAYREMWRRWCNRQQATR